MDRTTASTDLRAAIIIPHYEDAVRLERCLTALMDPGGAGARRGVEIVVVDNGSALPPLAITDRWPGIRLVHENQKGAALARNRGVAETSAPRLYFLDADCIPHPGWLATAHRVADRANIVGGRVEVFHETPLPLSGAEAFEAVFAFQCRDYVERQGFSVTANLLTRRDVFEAVGGFRDGVPEDRDWCLRAGDLGYGIAYVDELAVGHPTRADWPALRRKWLRLTREAFARDGSGRRVAWALRAVAIGASSVAHLPRMVSSDLAATDRCRGGITLMRLRLARAVWMLRQACGSQI